MFKVLKYCIKHNIILRVFDHTYPVVANILNREWGRFSSDPESTRFLFITYYFYVSTRMTSLCQQRCNNVLYDKRKYIYYIVHEHNIAVKIVLLLTNSKFEVGNFRVSLNRLFVPYSNSIAKSDLEQSEKYLLFKRLLLRGWGRFTGSRAATPLINLWRAAAAAVEVWAYGPATRWSYAE